MTQLHGDPDPLFFLEGRGQYVLIDLICLFVTIAKDMFLFIFYHPVVEKLQAIPCALFKCKYSHQGVHTLTVHPAILMVTNSLKLVLVSRT